MIDHNKLRGEVVYRRTYSRPLNEEGTVFETWEQTIERVIGHQRWLLEYNLAEALPFLIILNAQDIPVRYGTTVDIRR